MQIGKEKQEKILQETAEKKNEILTQARMEAKAEKKKIVTDADKEITKMAILVAEKIISQKG